MLFALWGKTALLAAGCRQAKRRVALSLVHDVAEALGDTGIARRIALPELTTAFQVQCRNATLIAGNVQRAAGQQQTAVDVDHVELGRARAVPGAAGVNIAS